MNILKQIDKYIEEYAFDCGTSGSRFDPDEFIKGVKEIISAEQELVIKQLEEAEEIEWDNRNNQAAMAYQRAQEIIKDEK